jgi:N-hydroxyarylamine O-acetyltransferase
VNALVLARPDVDCRYTLLNNKLVVRRLEGSTERRSLESVAELCEILETNFLLRLPDAPELGTAIAQLV